MNFAEARHNMIECQIKPNKVTDKDLVDSLASIQRELFVPEELQAVSYKDEGVEVKAGRFLMDPTVFARLVQALNIKATDFVLDVGCLSGYSTAVLSELADTVIGVEDDDLMVATANQLLGEQEFCNGTVMHGALNDGYQEQAPYDAILIEGAVTKVPALFLDQLNDGGRLVAVVCENGKMGQAILFTKEQNDVHSEVLFDVMIPYLTGFGPKDKFCF